MLYVTKSVNEFCCMIISSLPNMKIKLSSP